MKIGKVKAGLAAAGLYIASLQGCTDTPSTSTNIGLNSPLSDNGESPDDQQDPTERDGIILEIRDSLGEVSLKNDTAEDSGPKPDLTPEIQEPGCSIDEISFINDDLELPKIGGCYIGFEDNGLTPNKRNEFLSALAQSEVRKWIEFTKNAGQRLIFAEDKGLVSTEWYTVVNDDITASFIEDFKGDPVYTFVQQWLRENYPGEKIAGTLIEPTALARHISASAFEHYARVVLEEEFAGQHENADKFRTFATLKIGLRALTDLVGNIKAGQDPSAAINAANEIMLFESTNSIKTMAPYLKFDDSFPGDENQFVKDNPNLQDAFARLMKTYVKDTLNYVYEVDDPRFPIKVSFRELPITSQMKNASKANSDNNFVIVPKFERNLNR